MPINVGYNCSDQSLITMESAASGVLDFKSWGWNGSGLYWWATSAEQTGYTATGALRVDGYDNLIFSTGQNVNNGQYVLQTTGMFWGFPGVSNSVFSQLSPNPEYTGDIAMLGGNAQGGGTSTLNFAVLSASETYGVQTHKNTSSGTHKLGTKFQTRRSPATPHLP